MFPLRRLFLLGLLALAACNLGPRVSVPATPAVVPEAFVTPREASQNLDSPAVWHGPAGQHWLLVTAKATGRLLVFDAATGVPVPSVARVGTSAATFARPNGLAVADDLLFVVERDGARVQVLRLPELTPLGAFGSEHLERPYGLTVLPLGDGRYRLFVTDNYTGFLGAPPPDRALDHRIHRFEVTVADGALAARHDGAFGETAGPGTVRVAESILADAVYDRLLVADEAWRASTVHVYGADGRYAGRDLPEALFPHEAEGLALAACPDSTGFVVATDQAPSHSVFHVFDRASLAYRGSFTGNTTANTDGVALTLRAFGPFRRGAFFAVDDDAAVAAFDWEAIRAALHLPACGD